METFKKRTWFSIYLRDSSSWLLKRKQVEALCNFQQENPSSFARFCCKLEFHSLSDYRSEMSCWTAAVVEQEQRTENCNLDIRPHEDNNHQERKCVQCRQKEIRITSTWNWLVLYISSNLNSRIPHCTQELTTCRCVPWNMQQGHKIWNLELHVW